MKDLSGQVGVLKSLKGRRISSSERKEEVARDGERGGEEDGEGGGIGRKERQRRREKCKRKRK